MSLWSYFLYRISPGKTYSDQNVFHKGELTKWSAARMLKSSYRKWQNWKKHNIFNSIIKTGSAGTVAQQLTNFRIQTTGTDQRLTQRTLSFRIEQKALVGLLLRVSLQTVVYSVPWGRQNWKLVFFRFRHYMVTVGNKYHKSYARTQGIATTCCLTVTQRRWNQA